MPAKMNNAGATSEGLALLHVGEHVFHVVPGAR